MQVGDDKLEEERAAHQASRRELEGSVGGLQREVAALKGALQRAEEQVAGRERELEARGKEVALMNVQVRGGQEVGRS